MKDTAAIKSKLLMDPSCKNVIDGLRKLNIQLPKTSDIFGAKYTDENIDSGYVIKVEEKDVYELNLKNGHKVSNNSLISAYDESIATFSTIQGKAICVSHSLVYAGESNYLPINYITLKFYTGSSKIKKEIGSAAIETDHIDYQYKVDIARNKMEFLKKHCIDNSILFVDGPLIAGDAFTTFMPVIKEFAEHNILSCFVVKNTNSNLVKNYFAKGAEVYNSDLHWADDLLKPGQRTAFFRYTDARNSTNSKIFCYIKFFKKSSPVRVEFPTLIYNKFTNSISEVIDLTYYMFMAQGSANNPQMRLVAIAEMFARATIKLVNVGSEIRSLTPTINEERWGNI